MYSKNKNNKKRILCGLLCAGLILTPMLSSGGFGTFGGLSAASALGEEMESANPHSTDPYIANPYSTNPYIETSRDTRYIDYSQFDYQTEVPGEFELLYETEEARFYYREDRKIIAIQDKRNGYLWKTGLDRPFNDQVQDLADTLTPEEIIALNLTKENKLNATYIGIANSLLVIEYFDSGNSIKTLASSGQKNTEIQFTKESQDGSRWLFSVNFTDIKIQADLYITFHQNKISFELSDESLSGEGRSKIATVALCPFMGAAGGIQERYNPETQKFDIIENRPSIPGYVFVPDGSGALIRFNDYSINFAEYIGQMYGEDRAQSTYYSRTLNNLAPQQTTTLPVFGISHGETAAFVAYTSQSEEYLNIIARPAGNTTRYTCAFPKYIYNKEYYQVYNQRGDGYFSLLSQPNIININHTYEFLANTDPEYPPTYVGMAGAYREYLLNNNLLPNMIEHQSGIRLDFIMSDIKKNIFVYDQVTMTTTENISQIYSELKTLGISPITTTLLGWKSGGITGGKPWAADYDNNIGTQSDFEALFEIAKQNNITISLGQDYLNINKIMMSYVGNAATHVNLWHIINLHDEVLPSSAPALETAYASPVKSMEWLLSQSGNTPYSDYLSVSGITNTLLSSYDRDNPITRANAKQNLIDGFYEVIQSKALLLKEPASYLLKYAAAYLDAPVITSSHLIETDTVPFVQLVLRDYMTLFAPYANFSFYTQTDILRMIDYNVLPSFILTQNPSYLLAYTNSSDYYSTEYSKYKDLILTIDGAVNETLSQVNGASWINRETLAPGIILNTYQSQGDQSKKVILINYTEQEYGYGGAIIPPESAACLPYSPPPVKEPAPETEALSDADNTQGESNSEPAGHTEASTNPEGNPEGGEQ